MTYALYQIIGILLVVFLVLINLCNRVHKYEFVSERASGTPTILLLAGTHGNEPAGVYALQQLQKLIRKRKLTLTKGTCIIVPQVNRCGFFAGTRKNIGWFWPFDVNRKYTNNTIYPLNRNMMELIRRADIIIDLHEGWGYRSEDPKTVGSGVYAGDTKLAQTLVHDAVDHINEVLLKHQKPIFSTDKLQSYEGDLMHYSDQLKKHYILIETTGQKDAQPITTRILQHICLTTFIMWRLGLINEAIPFRL